MHARHLLEVGASSETVLLRTMQILLDDSLGILVGLRLLRPLHPSVLKTITATVLKLALRRSVTQSSLDT
jgi:hypothetical protein